ncbi:hypothetical protein GCM10009682_40110 [Luedemannella flava]|uniref:Uncharacterized protein n=1 Tax=Luedemannella flava TaxID=349316 RepID=A0ABP4YIT9_9ACTN
MISLKELVATMIVGLLAGVAILAVFDGLLALIGAGSFGDATGWLAVVLPLMILVEDFRAWRTAGSRRLIAGLAALGLGAGVGLGAAYAANSFANLVSGAVGAAVAVLVYTVVWFVWIRWLTGDQPVEG